MGWDSLLVTTGASQLPDLLDSPVIPTFVADSLAALLRPRLPARSRPATQDDVAELSDLLRRSGLSPDGLEARVAADATVVVPADDGTPAAVAGVLPVEPELGVVRGVAVDERLRGQALGSIAVAAAARRAATVGVRTLALFTDGATEFFRALGFETVARSDLAPAVLNAPDVAAHCADAAVAMVRTIEPYSASPLFADSAGAAAPADQPVP